MLINKIRGHIGNEIDTACMDCATDTIYTLLAPPLVGHRLPKAYNIGKEIIYIKLSIVMIITANLIIITTTTDRNNMKEKYWNNKSTSVWCTKRWESIQTFGVQSCHSGGAYVPPELALSDGGRSLCGLSVNPTHHRDNRKEQKSEARRYHPGRMSVGPGKVGFILEPPRADYSVCGTPKGILFLIGGEDEILRTCGVKIPQVNGSEDGYRIEPSTTWTPSRLPYILRSLRGGSSGGRPELLHPRDTHEVATGRQGASTSTPSTSSSSSVMITTSPIITTSEVWGAQT